MKKTFAVILTAALMATSIAGAALAEETQQPQEGQIEQTCCGQQGQQSNGAAFDRQDNGPAQRGPMFGRGPMGTGPQMPNGQQGQMPSANGPKASNGQQGQTNNNGQQGQTDSNDQQGQTDGNDQQGQTDNNGQQGQKPNGNPPQMPNGQQGQMPNGNPPQMPDGQQGQMPNGNPPQMPDGQQGQMPNGNPPQMPDGQQGQMPEGMPSDMNGGPGGEMGSVEYSAAATVTESSDGETYGSTADSENAVLVSGSEVTLTGATVTKTGSSDGESADFCGVNAAVLATDGATLTLTGADITSDGTHANGVFSYGSGTTVNVSDTTITTTGNNSGGIMTTGGATMNASNLTVSTSGNSSAAIRSDRGGGTVNVSEGSYDTSGVGSPAIYSTASITVSDATLSASNSEAVVIEGGNSVTLEDVEITGCDATLNGQSTQKTNVLIYQSMSGDASEGDSTFTMTGGSMTAETGSMFHVTNTTTTINLENVSFTYASDSDVFLDASADSWGSTGSNGGNVTLNLVNQQITGAILSDSVSSVTVNLDADSTWTLTGDSYVSEFNGDLSNVNLNGYTLYVNGTAVN